MKTQRVLALPAHVLQDTFSRRGFYFSSDLLQFVQKSVRSDGQFIDRVFAESTESFKQVIAVGVIRYDTKFLCIRRTRKSNRKVLRLRWTLMIGGHIDQEDENSSDPALSCLIRELKEEIGITPDKTPELIGLAVDPENPVGRLHIGFVFDVQVKSPSIEVHYKMDNLEFVNSTTKNLYNFMDECEIKSLADKLDPWSYLYISSTFPRNPYSWSHEASDHPELPLTWE